MAARYIVENDNETTTTIFALQNQNDKEYISYTYTTDVIEDTKEYQKTITINSTNKKYTKYDIQYTNLRMETTHMEKTQLAQYQSIKMALHMIMFHF